MVLVALVLGWGCPKSAPIHARLLGESDRVLEPFELVYYFETDATPSVEIANPRDFDGVVRIEDDGIVSTSTSSRRVGDTVRYEFSKRQRGRGRSFVEVVDDGDVIRRWPVRWVRSPEALEGVADAVRLRRAGEFEAALEAVAPIPGCPWQTTQAALERGNVHFKNGDVAAAEDAWMRTLEGGALVSPTMNVRRRQALAFAKIQRHEFLAAEEDLLAAEAIQGERARSASRIRTQYYRAIIASELGESQKALRLFRRTLRWCEAEGSADRPFYLHALSLELHRQGRASEALAPLEEIDPSTLDEGLRAAVHGQRGWLLLEQAEHGDRRYRLARAEAEFRAALEIAGLGAGAARLAVYSTGLAATRVALGALDEADEVLAELDAISDELPAMERWTTRFLAVEVALARRRPLEARRRLTEMFAAEDAHWRTLAANPRWLWFAYSGRTAELRGRARVAEDEYRRALRALREASARFTLWSSRSVFERRQQDLPLRLARLALRRGDDAAALEAIDWLTSSQQAALVNTRAIARASAPWRAYAAARASYEAARDKGCRGIFETEREACVARLRDLRTAAIEALEAFHAAAPSSHPEGRTVEAIQRRLGADASVLLVVRHEEEVLAIRLTKDAFVHTSSAAELRRWTDACEGETLFVVGDALELDEWEDARGRPLAERCIVAHLPSAGLLGGAAPQRGPRVIVGDPNGTLPGASKEVGRLAKKGDRLLVGSDARRARVLDALSGAGHLHFAGHAEVLAEAPYRTSLELAKGQSLSFEDVLLEVGPLATVVLNGCRTGADAQAGSLGLPHAFLTTGTAAVIATTRPVRDLGEAEWFTRALYDNGVEEHPGRAMRAAIRAERARGSNSWRSFRLWWRGPEAAPPK